MILPSGSSHKHIVDTDTINVYGLLPKQDLIKECRQCIPKEGDNTIGVISQGGTTATNVLSINLAVVWKGTRAYLFTGDAHLKDVTTAAEQFLSYHRPKLEKFEYVDVPHHGSRHSNVSKVKEADMRGLARVSSENYLLSHNGCNGTPSPITVTDILKSDKCKTLHFLYEERTKDAEDVQECITCETGPSMNTWKCCIIDESSTHIGMTRNSKIDTKLKTKRDTKGNIIGTLKFFPFQDS